MKDQFTRKCLVCGKEVQPKRIGHTPLLLTKHEFECFKTRRDLIPNKQVQFVFDRRLKIEEREENLKRLARAKARTLNKDTKGRFVPKKRILVAFWILGAVYNFWTIPEAHGQLAAGTHQAQYVQPYWPKDPDYKSFIIPIQDYYGYYGGQYGMPGRHYPNYGSQWERYPDGSGYYHGPSSGPSWGRDMSPEEYYGMRNRRYQYRGPYNNRPDFGNRW